MSQDTAPVDQYQESLAKVLDELHSLTGRDRRFSFARFAAFFVTLATFLGCLAQGQSLLWALLPAAVFIWLIRRHWSMLSRKERYERTAVFLGRGIERLTNDWQGKGDLGLEFLTEGHLYAGDLDVLGQNSLFQYLCNARTDIGRHTLANWLCQGTEPEEIKARQAAIKELSTNETFRLNLAVDADKNATSLHSTALQAWAGADHHVSSGRIRQLQILGIILPLTVIASAVTWVMTGNPLAFLLTGFATIAAHWRTSELVATFTKSIHGAMAELEVLSAVLQRFENCKFESPRLQELRKTLDQYGTPPAQQTRRLHNRVSWFDARLNQLLALPAFFMLWGLNWALAIERWRTSHGKGISQWLQVAGELEALCSLATFAAEHPDYAYPEVSENDEACFRGEELGHPLLAADKCVCNGIQLSDNPKLIIISGSNMSGKSTFLRTVGLNAILAQAGAPICGKSLIMSRLRLATSIQIRDSIQDGISHFYAEIKRLKDIFEQSNEEPALLFLIDEILHGTNSHDRRIGVQAVLGELLKRHALGFITTHDLELSKMAERAPDAIRNVHFCDSMKDGKLHFDYLLHDGVVQHSNALKLMKSLGLPVEEG